LLLFSSVCETSPNSYVYSLSPLQTAKRISEVEGIEAKVECLVQQKKEVRVAAIATCTTVKVIRILTFLSSSKKEQLVKFVIIFYLIYYTNLKRRVVISAVSEYDLVMLAL
jgi:hypothetical protein